MPGAQNPHILKLVLGTCVLPETQPTLTSTTWILLPNIYLLVSSLHLRVCVKLQNFWLCRLPWAQTFGTNDFNRNLVTTSMSSNFWDKCLQQILYSLYNFKKVKLTLISQARVKLIFSQYFRLLSVHLICFSSVYLFSFFKKTYLIKTLLRG